LQPAFGESYALAMPAKQSAPDPQIILDRIITGLREGRNKAMQQRKAAIQREFMIARRWVDDAYSVYTPEDLPVDVHRIVRDLTVTRDTMVDNACAEVDKEYRIAVGVLKLVAEQNPGYYSSAAKEVQQPRGWKRPLPTVSAPKIASVLPEHVLMGLSSARISEVVTMLLETKTGITLNELARRMKLNAPDQLQARAAVKRFAVFLRENRHVEVEGTGRGQKMKAAASLKTLRDTLVNETEA
jgi:hypothetical protein